MRSKAEDCPLNKERHFVEFSLRNVSSAKFRDKKRRFSLLLEISRWTDLIFYHAIFAIYHSNNVHEIHDRSSAEVLKSRIQTMRNNRLTYQE